MAERNERNELVSGRTIDIMKDIFSAKQESPCEEEASDSSFEG